MYLQRKERKRASSSTTSKLVYTNAHITSTERHAAQQAAGYYAKIRMCEFG